MVGFRMRGDSRWWRRVAQLGIAFALTGGCLVAALVAGPTAGASPSGDLLDCTAAGAVYPVVDPATDNVAWTLGGQGFCNGMSGNYFMSFSGSGTSQGLSVCTLEPFVRNLDLAVTVNLVDSTTPGAPPFVYQQRWNTPATTFPFNTQWSIQSGGSTVGAGEAFTRIFFHCPGNGGSPTGNLDFRFSG